MTKDTIWIWLYRGNESKRVQLYERDQMLRDGWKDGLDNERAAKIGVTFK